ncbi:MAG: hypothetical protein WC866_05505 [Patescibacteria group bacterium]|jgi:hypothetical protein
MYTMTLPMMIVWFIALSVTLIVTWAAASHRVKGEPIGMALLTLAAITFWFTGLILGFFVTHFSSPTLETWWHALVVRVAWQIGGALLFGLAILTDALLTGARLRRPGTWLFVAVCVAIGALASFNPLRDLIEGPAVLRGAAQIDVERHTRVKGGASIRAEVRLTTPDGDRYAWNLVGWPAEKAEEALGQCVDMDDVEITMLRRTKRVIDTHCR